MADYKKRPDTSQYPEMFDSLSPNQGSRNPSRQNSAAQLDAPLAADGTLRTVFHALIREKVSTQVPNWIAHLLVVFEKGELTVHLCPGTSPRDERLPGLRDELEAKLNPPFSLRFELHERSDDFLRAMNASSPESRVFYSRNDTGRAPGSKERNERLEPASMGIAAGQRDSLFREVTRTLPLEIELLNQARFRVPLRRGTLDVLNIRAAVPAECEARLDRWMEEFEARHSIRIVIERSKVFSGIWEQLCKWTNGENLMTQAHLPQLQRYMAMFYGTPPAAPNGEIIPAGLTDMTGLDWVAIDSPDTLGREDVLYCEPSKTPGNLRLLVGIIDVTPYVKPGSYEDEYAQRTGSSIFGSNTVIPTLGIPIAHGPASFLTGEARPAWVTELEISPPGVIGSSTVRRRKVMSHSHLSPEQVAELLERKQGAPANLIHLQEAASRLHAARRRQRKVMRIDGDDVGHTIVSEAMIAAKIATARFIAGRQNAIFRIHSPMDSKWRDQMAERLSALGISVGPLDFDDPVLVGRVLHRLQRQNGAGRTLMRELLDGLVPRSRSDTINRGHLGAAADAYMNLKPRDAEGIANQYQLLSIFDPSFAPLSLEELGDRAERRNRQREETDTIGYKVRFLERLEQSLPLIGQTMEASVAKRGENHLFVDVPGFTKWGLVELRPGNNSSYAAGQQIRVTLEGFGICQKRFLFSTAN